MEAKQMSGEDDTYVSLLILHFDWGHILARQLLIVMGLLFGTKLIMTETETYLRKYVFGK